MSKNYLVSFTGRDQPGIVAAVSRELAALGCNLGDTSMVQLAGNFCMMMVVSGELDDVTLRQRLAKVCEQLELNVHVDTSTDKHQQPQPDVQITVNGADRPGIVAEVTARLAQAGLNIVDLETVSLGEGASAAYMLTLLGVAGAGVEVLQDAVDELNNASLSVHLSALETLVG